MNTTKVPNFGKADAPEVVAGAPADAQHLALLDQHLQSAAVEVGEAGSPMSGYMLELAQDRVQKIHAAWGSLPTNRRTAHLLEVSYLVRSAIDAPDCTSGRAACLTHAMASMTVFVPALCVPRPAPLARPSTTELSGATVTGNGITADTPLALCGHLGEMLLGDCASSVETMLDKMLDTIEEDQFSNCAAEECFYLYHGRAKQLMAFIYAFFNEMAEATPSLAEVAKATRFEHHSEIAPLLAAGAAKEAA